MNYSNDTDVCFQIQEVSRFFNPIEKNFESLIQMIYGIPTIMLDLVLVVFLIKQKDQKDFSRIFSILFSIAGIIEISEWIAYNFRQRLSNAPLMSFLYAWLPNDGMIVSIIYFVDSYLAYLNHIPSLLLASNRLTAVMFPITYENKWRKAIKPILVIYFLYPMIFTWHFLFLSHIRHCQIWNVDLKYSYHVFVTQPPYYWIPLYIDVTIVSFLVSVSCLIINTMTTILLIRNRKYRQTGNSTERKNFQMEIKMFIITLWMFINEFTLGIITLVIYFSMPSRTTAIMRILPFIVDLICLTPPWMLIITSKKIRSKFIALFKKNQAVVGIQQVH